MINGRLYGDRVLTGSPSRLIEPPCLKTLRRWRGLAEREEQRRIGVGRPIVGVKLEASRAASGWQLSASNRSIDPHSFSGTEVNKRKNKVTIFGDDLFASSQSGRHASTRTKPSVYPHAHNSTRLEPQGSPRKFTVLRAGTTPSFLLPIGTAGHATYKRYFGTHQSHHLARVQHNPTQPFCTPALPIR